MSVTEIGGKVLIPNPIEEYYDTHTLFIDCGVATEDQISCCLKEAIRECEKILGERDKKSKIRSKEAELRKLKPQKNNRNLQLKKRKVEKEIQKLKSRDWAQFRQPRCRFKINLLRTKEGAYHGYGYIRVSCTEIYWMLLGKNPDGTERVEFVPDPDWQPPSEEIMFKLEEDATDSWSKRVEKEESFIRPNIRKELEPLVKIGGYLYDHEQLEHLKELARENGENDDIPQMGYFEISRGYAKGVGPGKVKNKICARNIPDWIPKEAFEIFFTPYTTSYEKKQGKGHNKYPQVSFAQTKKGKIVFITFDPATNDAYFALLMQKKTRISHPEHPNDDKYRCELIFTHAYDNNSRKR